MRARGMTLPKPCSTLGAQPTVGLAPSQRLGRSRPTPRGIAKSPSASGSKRSIHTARQSRYTCGTVVCGCPTTSAGGAASSRPVGMCPRGGGPNRFHPDVERLGLLGWRLCPSSRSTRATCIARAADLATCDLDQLERWSREFTGCNWRVVMKGSGIWALDVDVPSEDHDEDGMKALSDLVDVHGPLPLRRPYAPAGRLCSVLQARRRADRG